MVKYLIALVQLTLLGCATATPQADLLLKEHFKPMAVEITDVPFIEQKSAQCGPATLAMALQWAGHPVNVDELAKQVYTPGMKGSLQSDMISAARRSGMMAIPVAGFPALLAEIRAGHPVIVFENLSVSWLPQWHYALVFGYDLNNEKIVMHSGPEAYKHWDLRVFERSWQLGEYWGLVVLPANELSASADEGSHVAAAAALEQLGKVAEANKAYAEILKRWPKSLIAKIGLANIAYDKKDFRRAVKYLRQASAEHPQSAIVWHNRVFAEAAVGQTQRARDSAVKALQWVSPEQHSAYATDLQSWIN